MKQGAGRDVWTPGLFSSSRSSPPYTSQVGVNACHPQNYLLSLWEPDRDNLGISFLGDLSAMIMKQYFLRQVGNDGLGS